VQRVEGPKPQPLKVASAILVFGRQADKVVRAAEESRRCASTVLIGVFRDFQCDHGSRDPLSVAEADQMQNGFDSVSLVANPGLILIVSEPAQAAGVQIDAQGSE